MSWRKTAIKKNVPRVNLQDYNILIAGGFKSGKTRLWKELMELHFPDEPDAGLLLAFEDGYTTWELDSIIPMHKYDWDYFKKVVVKNLVEEAKQGSITKVIGVDTIDRMMDCAAEWFIKEWNNKYSKTYTSIQELNENIKDENVYVELKKEVWRQVDALKTAGYGFVWLAWTKEKETTTVDGLKFQSIELMMSKTGKDIFESQAHLIACLFNEVTVTDKTGTELEENGKDKKKKDIASKFHKTETLMYFRPSSYIGIAGGRFTDLPEKIEYSAENFMKVFTDAVEGQLKKGNRTVEEVRVEQEEIKVVEKAEAIQAEVIETKKVEDEAEIAEKVKVLHLAIKTATTPLMKDAIKKAAVVAEYKKIFKSDKADYTIIKDVAQLEVALNWTKDTYQTA